MTTVLQVEGLHKAFGGVQAVADLSFAVDAGELVALIGPNGAGKSTCFNMLNGQLAPDAGIVRLDGRDIVGLRPRAVWRLGVGRTFQITATFASLSVRENVQTALHVNHRQPGEATQNLDRKPALRHRPRHKLCHRADIFDRLILIERVQFVANRAGHGGRVDLRPHD
jgi:ABC-type branched-subunit amino acid transport system ATPase component